MPSSFLSHQAPVLWLKTKWPKRFDGTSLCVGSFAPDYEWVLSLFNVGVPERKFHTVGELVYLLPVSLALIVFLDKVFLPAASYSVMNNRLGPLSRLLSFFGVDEWHVLKTKKINAQWLVKALYSFLLGVLTHFLLDLPSHSAITYLEPFFSAEMPAWFLYEYGKISLPIFGFEDVTNFNLVWLVLSILFGVIALYQLRTIKKHKLVAKWYGA